MTHLHKHQNPMHFNPAHANEYAIHTAYNVIWNNGWWRKATLIEKTDAGGSGELNFSHYPGAGATAGDADTFDWIVSSELSGSYDLSGDVTRETSVPSTVVISEDAGNFPDIADVQTHEAIINLGDGTHGRKNSAGLAAPQNDKWSVGFAPFYTAENTAGRTVYVNEFGFNYRTANQIEKNSLTGTTEPVNYTNPPHQNTHDWIHILPLNERTTFSEYKCAHKLDGSTDVQILQSLLDYRDANDMFGTVVLDQAIEFADKDSRINLWAGLELFGIFPFTISITTANRTASLANVVQLRSNSQVSQITFNVGAEITSEVVLSPVNTENTLVDKCRFNGELAAQAAGYSSFRATKTKITNSTFNGFLNSIVATEYSDFEARGNQAEGYYNKGIFLRSLAVAVKSKVHDNTLGFPATVAQDGANGTNSRQPISYAISNSAAIHRDLTVTDNTLLLPGIAHDGTPIGRSTPSNSSSDAISIHRGIGGVISGNYVDGSGELGINHSLGCEDIDTHTNTIVNDEIGAISVGVEGDNTGNANGTGIRNKRIRVFNNKYVNSITNKLNQSPASGMASMYLYACDDCEAFGNTGEYLGNNGIPNAMIAMAGAGNAKVVNNNGKGYDREIRLIALTNGTGLLTNTFEETDIEAVASFAELPTITNASYNRNRQTYAIEEAQYYRHRAAGFVSFASWESGDRTAAGNDNIAVTTTFGNFSSSLPENIVNAIDAPSNATGSWAFQNSPVGTAGDYVRLELKNGGAFFSQINIAAGNIAGEWRLQGSLDAVTWVDLSEDTEGLANLQITKNAAHYNFIQIIWISGTFINNWIDEITFTTSPNSLGTSAWGLV